MNLQLKIISYRLLIEIQISLIKQNADLMYFTFYTQGIDEYLSVFSLVKIYKTQNQNRFCLYYVQF